MVWDLLIIFLWWRWEGGGWNLFLRLYHNKMPHGVKWSEGGRRKRRKNLQKKKHKKNGSKISIFANNVHYFLQVPNIFFDHNKKCMWCDESHVWLKINFNTIKKITKLKANLQNFVLFFCVKENKKEEKTQIK